ncbi:MAG: zinc-dependent metalloprotease family protein, partial [Bacteroidota bacterium]
LALACTGEYAAFHGGTVNDVIDAYNTSLTRVNGVYEREVAIHMNIISGVENIIFLNGATDPYDNGNGGAMLGQNQTTCDNNIGSANYDIGHVYSTGGGGVAYLQSPCGNLKAGGVTGQGSPVGDPFDIDYVCHEMGHQYGGNHTQNNSCNRASSAAFEPGSASTIMGYAGICSPNLQSNSDDYFHIHSFNEMVAFSVSGNGNTCATVTNTGNIVPTVSAGNDYTIPGVTPFELTASGNDGDGDELTYTWEQYDLGPATAGGDNDLSQPSGNQPTFRSWKGTTDPTRVFPRIQDLVNNTTVVGEHLPDYDRNMNFRCSVRDNRAGGGGVNEDEMTIT